QHAPSSLTEPRHISNAPRSPPYPIPLNSCTIIIRCCDYLWSQKFMKRTLLFTMVLATIAGFGAFPTSIIAQSTTVQVFKGHDGFVTSVDFSSDGNWVLTGSYDKTARLWDINTGLEVRRFTGHTDPVQSVAFSPDVKTVITGSYDKTARLWDADT